MINGILNVYKEPGFTSFDVVAKLRGILKQKKIGHTGTLDPMAEGVLVVCLGKATKLVDMVTAGDKNYHATILLGKTTDTEDITGSVIEEKEVLAEKEEIIEVINSFTGEYLQIPPMYSAIKKDGKKLYEYAREGKTIERTARAVNIYSIENININSPLLSFDVKCSKGTYIRSLARDIGERLGCGACLSGLKRNEVHGFYSEDALKLEDIKRLNEEAELDKYILPIDSILKDYPRVAIKEKAIKLLQNGNKLNKASFDGELPLDETIFRVYDGDNLIALYKAAEDTDIYRPFKMFLD